MHFQNKHNLICNLKKQIFLYFQIAIFKNKISKQFMFCNLV
jgi:hypothetical protein